MRPALILLAAALALSSAGALLAHNGEYVPPLPPPRIPKGGGRSGVPTRPPEPDRGAVTPDPGPSRPETPEPDAPEDRPDPGAPDEPPGPDEPIEPRGPRLGVGRDDSRLSVEIWWEANRHRFLPPLPTLPYRDELTKALLETIEGESDTVRDRALLALGRIGSSLAFDRIRKSLDTDVEILRASALVALGLLGEEAASPLLRRVVADGHTSAHVRAHAALGLGLLGDPEDASFLREVLDEEWDGNIRCAAALGLGLLKDERSVRLLGRILTGRHPLAVPEPQHEGRMRLRIGLAGAAARSLGEVFVPRTYDYLIWAVERAEPHVQGAAAIVLATAPGTAGVPALRKSLAPGNPLQLRQYALMGLAERKDPTAIELAGELLASPPERDGLVGPFAAIALGLAGDRTKTGALLAIVKDRDVASETRAGAALALGILGDRKAAPVLETLLADEKDPAVVGRLLLADSLLGGRRALERARKVLEESDLPGPRRDAVTALGILAVPDTAEQLVALLADSYHVNREAALALARVDPKRAANELLRRLGDPNVNAGRHAACALGALLDRKKPGRLSALVARSNLLCGAPVVKACLHLENEYLYSLVWNF